ncbi:YceD family protein [Limnobacter sp.]|uniref:YceD family protein n=1 Tax=Limnobacter sp. TaxID=2003368 RepID=UPI0035119FC8
MRHKASQKEWDEFDAWAFCRLGGVVRHSDVGFEFPRLREDPTILSFEVQHWEVSGHMNAKGESVLKLQGQFNADFACVACGLGVPDSIPFTRFLILKKSEAEADAYDDEALDEDTDVVACPGAIQLRDFLEDELLLACPMFPRHDHCRPQQEADTSAGEAANPNESAPTEVQRPFANLGDLLKAGKK